MSTVSSLAYEPVSSGEIPSIDLERADEVERRHRLLAEHLELRGDEGLLIQKPSNFAWLTCGGRNTRPGTNETVASAFLTTEARVLLCHSVDSQQLFDRELPVLGFQLKERPWGESHDVLRDDLCRGRQVACDVPEEGLRDAGAELEDFRRRLGERELTTLRSLGRSLAHAVEATCRMLHHGDTEAEVAGHVAHRLMRHEINPTRIQVMADGQGHRYRHWGFGGDRIERYCVISVVAERLGLHCGVTRTVSLGQPPSSLLESHQLAALIAATGMFFSQAGWEATETWQRVQRIYEKFGAPDEWRLADQGEVTGYEAMEQQICPKNTTHLSAGMPIFWHPTVNAAGVGETIIVHSEHAEHITRPEDWPRLEIVVKGKTVHVPDVLCREV